MMYTVCEYCGAHLDPGESCECRCASGECRDEEMRDALSRDDTAKMKAVEELCQ